MPDPQRLTSGLRDLVWSVESEVEVVTGLSRRIDDHVKALNRLRDELALRLEALDALHDAAAGDEDLARYLDRVADAPLPRVAEEFPARMYG